MECIIYGLEYKKPIATSGFTPKAMFLDFKLWTIFQGYTLTLFSQKELIPSFVGSKLRMRENCKPPYNLATTT
ncbi:MAG: hypothetical protein KF829_03850 [Ferruginibacter sp.]|nr:hypothetical protein [Ferruginibacter sp.]